MLDDGLDIDVIKYAGLSFKYVLNIKRKKKINKYKNDIKSKKNHLIPSYTRRYFTFLYYIL